MNSYEKLKMLKEETIFHIKFALRLRKPDANPKYTEKEILDYLLKELCELYEIK